ncbi:unnamed protein product [Caenorhabditis brenneri]
MDSPLRHLQMMLRNMALLAQEFDGSHRSINVIHALIDNFDSRILQQFLPGTFSRAFSSVFDIAKESSAPVIKYSDVYKDDYCHVNVFGLLRAGQRIPLHDHPDQHAIMKVFQGSLKVRSYSIVEYDENGTELNLDEEHMFHSRYPPQDSILVRYEGETVLSSRGGQHSAWLGERKGNLHEVICLEPHTYFCDFFFPNSPYCYYYRPDPSITEPLAVGSPIVMQRICCPSDFITEKLDFPSVPAFRFGVVDSD